MNPPTRPPAGTGRDSLQPGAPLRTPCAAPATLGEALERAAARAPAAGILHVRPGAPDRPQTYAALLDEARHVAGGLLACGLRPGDRLVLHLADAADFLAAFWGAALAGGVPLPVWAAEAAETPARAGRRLVEACRILDAPRVVAGGRAADAVAAALRAAAAPCTAVLGMDDLRRAAAAPPAAPAAAPDDLALLLLTSGSTWAPKAVRLSHRNLLAGALAAALHHGIGPDDVSLDWMPLDHVGGLVMFHVRDVVAGCRQIRVPTEVVSRSPLRWLDLAHHHRATLTWAPNFAFALVNDQAAGMAGRGWDLGALRWILCAGEPVVSRTLRRFLELLEPFGLPETSVRTAWGMSETASAVTYSEPYRRRATTDADRHVEVGAPLPGTSLRIVDAEERLVPDGTTGALQVRGPTVTAGYWDDPEATRAAFTPDGWLRTGDLGVLHAGRLTIVGRAKDVLIVRGANFAASEIEAVVEGVPGVLVTSAAACAVRRPGDDSDRVAIFLSTESATPAAQHDLGRRVRVALGRELHIRPDHLVLLPRDGLPRTPTGKLQRAVLRQRFEAGEFDARALRTGAAPPGGVPLHREVWRPIEIPALQPPPEGPWLVCGGTGDLAAALCRELECHGRRCVVAVPGAAERLHAVLQRDGIVPRQLVHLGASDASMPPEALLASALELVRVFGPASERLWLVTRRGRAVAAGEDVNGPAAGLAGLARTLGLELEAPRCTLVEVGDDGFEALRREIGADDARSEVAWRAGQRLVPRLAAVEPELPGVDALLVHGGCYLVSGGLGGIGTLLVRHLLQGHAARLLVIGRRPVTNVAGALRALDAGGQRLLYVAADVADADAVRAAADAAAARWGRALDGVFHLAGTWEARPLAEESAATLARALHAKVGGALALHRLVAERPGTLVVHFGSLVGCFGGAASGAYAAANAFLIGLAHHERCLGLRSTCLSWSTWQGLGMSAGHELAAGLRAKGYRPLAADEGLDALWAALRCDVPHVLVGLEPRSALARRHVDDGADDAPEPDRPRLAARTPTEGRLARIWADVLEQDAVGADETFFALGGDSLLAARVMAQIEAELGLDLPTAALFRAPTVAGLAAVVDRAGAGPRPYRLVPLQPEGRRAPLFCLPGAWDEAAVFADLVACLGPEQPVWGVQASSLDGTSRCDPAASFEAIAAGFVAEICALQPRGPYHLAGHCLGGLLAYEVAQQLVAQGEAVGLLALLDTLVGESLHTRTAAPMRLRLAHHGDALRHRPLRQRLAYLRAAAARLRHDRAARRRRRRELAPLEAMYQRYDLRSFPGRLVLVLASESFFGHDPEHDPRLGWRRLAGGGCDLVVVRGDHESLLRPPHVRDLAAGLEAALAAS